MVSGTDAWVRYPLDPTPKTGVYCSLACIGNWVAAVAYFDSNDGALKYARHNDVTN